MWARKNGEARGKWVRAEKCSCKALPVARPALRIAFARLSLEEGEKCVGQGNSWVLLRTPTNLTNIIFFCLLFTRLR